MNPVLQYIIRAINYFFYFTILLTLIMTVLILTHFVDGNIETMFVNGYDSIWQIALMFAVIAAVYPYFGYVKKSFSLPGEYSELRDKIIQYMESRGYRLESEKGENMTFRNRNLLKRLTRMFEDRISLTRILGGFEIEGLRKDCIFMRWGLMSLSKPEENPSTEDTATKESSPKSEN